ncbi:MAG: Mrp/NBP35 family ATP-binding protein [Candidatus Pelethousia sp.]|nr:Mrp/NBP35 family ATP-binding protein [Candidatus Pelethousia sp.]
MSECTHDCSTCGSDCPSRQDTIPKEPVNAMSRVGRVIGVVSGKGGVGKSLVTGMLACALQKGGRQAAVLDADITGPSIPKLFGVNEQAIGNEEGLLFAAESKSGVRLMSINLLLEDTTTPVVWRGPVIAGAVKQFWTDVIWGNVDYMFVDMPPGTGDVPLTVFQSLPVDAILVVTTPQSLVSMIVEKAVNMAAMMKVPVLGVVENMSYFTCPDCGKKCKVFGESHVGEIAAKYGLPLLGTLPIDPAVAAACDEGRIQDVPTQELQPAVDAVLGL